VEEEKKPKMLSLGKLIVQKGFKGVQKAIDRIEEEEMEEKLGSNFQDYLKLKPKERKKEENKEPCLFFSIEEAGKPVYSEFN